MPNEAETKTVRTPGERGRKSLLDRYKIQGFLDQGMTQIEIADALGYCRSAIERACRRWGLGTSRTGPKAGPGHRDWKGGRTIEKFGYVGIWAPLHPEARLIGHVLEHRLVMEIVLKRYLSAIEVVDHLDSHPYHNWPSNLKLHKDNAAHLKEELAGKWASSRRWLIPGAYGSNRSIDHCPSEGETLAQCPAEIRMTLSYYIESHRPTTEYRSLSRLSILRTGAWRDPFPPESMG